MKIFILEDDRHRIEYFMGELFTHQITICNNAEDAIKILSTIEFDRIFLDHDLGGEIYVNSDNQNTGYQVAKFLSGKGIDRKIIIHSLNRPGSLRMLSEIPEAKYIPFMYLKRLNIEEELK